MEKLLLKKFISEKVALPEREWEEIQVIFKPLQIKTGTLLLAEGKICRHLYFLNSGLLRWFFWRDGLDRTKYFLYENYVFTAIQSFSNQTPATENIEALEDCDLLAAHYDDADRLYDQCPAWRRFVRQLIQEVQVYTEEILTEFQTETAEARYRRLLAEEPELVRRVPLKYLASYLGIAPESLSRIRKMASRT